LQKRFVYCRCQTVACPTKTIREDKVDESIIKALNPFQLDGEEIDYARVWAQNARLRQDELREMELRNLKLFLDQNLDRRMRLTDAFLDGSIDRDLFEERKVSLLFEETGLKEKSANLDEKNGGSFARLEKFLELAKTASFLYKLALPDEKRDLLKKLTSNLKVAEKNVDVELTIPAQLVANRAKNIFSSLALGSIWAAQRRTQSSQRRRLQSRGNRVWKLCEVPPYLPPSRLCRTHHGAQNSSVGSASAEVARESLLHAFRRRIPRFPKQRLCGHDHAVGAVTALCGLFGNEGGLDRASQVCRVLRES
jgi:hypothetical protein